VTQIFGRIYVVCCRSNKLGVFDSRTYKKLKSRTVHEASDNLLDMAGCRESRCLYLVDSDNNCVWSVAVNDEKRVYKCLSKYVAPPTRISVISQGRLLMINQSAPELVIYKISPNENLVSTHTITIMQQDVGEIMCAKETPDGDFVCCFTENSASPNRICIVNHRGSVSSICDIQPRKLSMNQFLDMALDNVGHVFFTDYSNCRLSGINLDLSIQNSEMLMWDEGDGERYPVRVNYMDISNILLVSLEARNKRTSVVDVFKICSLFLNF